jgi:hypothetical protein
MDEAWHPQVSIIKHTDEFPGKSTGQETGILLPSPGDKENLFSLLETLLRRHKLK